MQKKGKIFILSGPSGSGKTTLYKKLLDNEEINKKITKTISITTRSKRLGEEHGKDYFFISKKMFDYKIRAGHFLEWEKVFDNYYGTANKQVKDILNKNKNVLLCIDVKGAKQVKKKHTDAIMVFIKTPNLDVLAKRLKERGSETDLTYSLRLKTAKEELKESSNYQHIVVNDSLEVAYIKLKEIIFSHIN